MPTSDRAFRVLARAQPDSAAGLLRLAAPEAFPASLAVTPIELDQSRLDAVPPPIEADWIARLGEEVIHLECQGYRDAGFPDRLVHYHLRTVLWNWKHRVRTFALWLIDPPKRQAARRLVYGDITVRTHAIVLPQVSARLLLTDPRTACFAPGAHAGEWTDEELCERVAGALRAGNATLHELHMAAVCARMRSKRRYDIMLREMERQQLEPVIIQDLVHIGEDIGFERGLEKGLEKGLKKGLKKGLEKGLEKGVAKGRAVAVLDVLHARGMDVSGQVRERIVACADLDELTRLLTRALSVTSAEQLFEP